MSRLVGLFAVALIASHHAAAAQVQQARTIAVRLPAYDNPVVLDTMESLRHHEDVTRVAVFMAARKAFEELEIPVAYADSAHGIILNAELSLTRRLGKFRMSQIVDCGTNLNGPVADQYRIRMAVGVIADSIAPSQSEYRVLIAAGAQSLEGATRPPVGCGTTGVLEERIAKVIGVKIWGS